MPPADRYMGGRGETYRPPGGRSPPPRRDYSDSYRARSRSRSPPPRSHRDDYYRRRSPSPPRYRERERESYRAPTRREDLPRDDLFRRDPPPRRTPPRRGYSPRRRSPTPPRYGRHDYASDNGRDSGATSRRSSPPVHASRMMQVGDRPSRPPPHDPYDSREPYRARSPEPRRPVSPPRPAYDSRDRYRSRTPESRPRAVSPRPRDIDYADDRGYGADDRIPPPRDPYRSDDIPPPRAPPTGPAGYRAPPTPMAPPTGPSAPSSSSAYPHTPVAPPSGPRGAPPARGDYSAPRGRGGYRGGRGGFESSVPYRGGRGGTLPYAARGGPPSGPSYGRNDSYEMDVEYNNGPPTGPSSAAPPSGPRGSFSSAPPPQPYRQSSNTTATTYPRTQRFGPGGQPLPNDSPRTGTPTGPRASLAPRVHPAIADLPKPIEGGQKAEPLVDVSKLVKLQEEAERLRREIAERETKKRKSLWEWDRLERERDAAAVRSELAEEALRNVTGEAEGAAAF